VDSHPRSRIAQEMMDVQRAVRALAGSLRRLVPLLTAAATNGTQPERPRRRPRLSAKARASLVLQGRYMGYIRQLKPRQKAQVRKVKDAKGVRVAILRARALRGMES